MAGKKMLAALLIGMLAISGLAYAQTVPAQGINELREKVENAIDEGNYTAWAEAMAEAPGHPYVLEVVNESNFGSYCEMHEHLEAAKEIADELGLRPGRPAHIGARPAWGMRFR